MARYVIANRRSGLHRDDERVRSRLAVAATLDSLASAMVLEDFAPAELTARRIVVVDADPAEVAAAAFLPGDDVIIEPEILHFPVATPPRDLMRSQPAPAVAADAVAPLTLTVLGAGAPLAEAGVTLYLRALGSVTELEGRTGANGEVRFTIPPGFQLTAALVEPRGGFWTMVARGAQLMAPIDCPALPANGPLAWWHHALGQGAFDAQAGAGIRVGVIDSGLSVHPALAHAIGIGAFINGTVTPGTAAAAGVNAHGTHVAGLIGARPAAAGDYAGVAPGCDLFAARVFAPGRGANQGDIASAIDALSIDRRCDLINLSLGAPTPSDILREAILDAVERGTLCIAAAGNNAGAVNFPAAFPEVIAVSAFGLEGWGPPGSLSATRLADDPALYGRAGFYIANFSCFGAAVDCTGPGVGIISTVPSDAGGPGLYRDMDGTSMASPAVCGALAVLLARDPAYGSLPRSTTRAQAARQVLNQALTQLGVPSPYQGGGVPTL